MTSQESPTPNPKGDRIRDRFFEFLESARLELTKVFQIGRLKYDTTALQRERASIYRELGMKAAELIKQNRIDVEELKPMIERIDVLTGRIEERRVAVETLIRTRNDTRGSTGQN